MALACSGAASEKVPLTRRPVAVADGSETLSERVTGGGDDVRRRARRVRLATPGVNAPNVAGVPSDSASVAGTVPVAPPGVYDGAQQLAHPVLELLRLGQQLRPRGGVAAGRVWARSRRASMSLSDEL